MKRFRLKSNPEEVPGEPRKETRGRKSSYQPAYARMAESHCKLGATDAELGELFSVSTVTIWTWSNKHPEFNAALRQGKHAWDARVERSLAQRAIGYAVDTEEIKVVDKTVVRVPIRKHFPPDTTACIFWLKNRQPERWRDVYDHKHKVEDDTKTVEELRKEILAEAAELGILPEQVLLKGVANVGNGKGTKH